ncbi:MAG: AAA family ATPase [Alphaproteobacteria bacterium]|nr:AAA family ATPase [Alphaproteobacteria bacterium]QQS56856.1 MAG: AAA family ATPase [Alphaproteobacteria bacterium]
MYFKRIQIENYGPLKDLDINFPFYNTGKPKPLIIVGKNGSGKSIFLSHLVNALTLTKAKIYPSTEVEDGKVYKLRSANYITTGQNYAFMKLHISDGLEFYEWVLRHSKKDFEDIYQFTPARREWTQIPDAQNSIIENNFEQKSDELKKFVDENCSLYFPPNRFEEPSWLNEFNLLSKPEHTDKNRIVGKSSRNIICHSPLKANMNWLFDLVLDRELYEKQIINIPLPNENEITIQMPVFQGYLGPSHTVYEEALKLLRVILKDENLRFGVGNRQSRVMSIMKEKKTYVPHIFQLSTGETALLNLFLSILRDFDLSGGALTSLENITGTVIIDEIDAHLHTQLQYEVLPQLISLFPQVQFIITTHSPLFLLGLENTFGEDGFEILELPNGNTISTERFSEFEDAYQTFIKTEKFQNSLEAEILKSQKPIVFVEGNHDIQYISKAAELLEKNNLLSKIHIKDGGGYKNLDKIWGDNKWSDSQLVNKKIVLLYDCDTNKTDEDRNNIYKRIIPIISSNPISKGIENLFPEAAIDKAETHKPDFIDIEEETQRRERGRVIAIPRRKSINKDEKANICNWLCENGDESDFSNFIKVFEIIEEALSLSDTDSV